jgi:hypothetical protein
MSRWRRPPEVPPRCLSGNRSRDKPGSQCCLLLVAGCADGAESGWRCGVRDIAAIARGHSQQVLVAEKVEDLSDDFDAAMLPDHKFAREMHVEAVVWVGVDQNEFLAKRAT